MADTQLHGYRMTYGEVESTIGRDGSTKGILFWRWAAEDPTIVIGAPDEAATLRMFLSCFLHPCAS